MKIALLGYGKMGKTIERLATKKGHTIVMKTTSTTHHIDITQVDVALEFSTPEAALQNITLCLNKGIPIVSGTTGWLANYKKMIKLCESRNGSFIYASNFSIGVNLFYSINDYLAKLMETKKEYQVSIEEIHHKQKLDAPSGTAISLAEGILKHSDLANIKTGKKGWKLNNPDSDEYEENKINITAKRINDMKGTHEVIYNSKIDTISIKHQAHSRDGFALGAILAAEWLVDKKGVFTMKDVLNIK